MKRVTLFCTILIVALIGVGCNNQKPPTGPSESAPMVPPSLHKGPPASSGPIVIRFEGGAGMVFDDPQRQLVAVFCSEDGFFCGPSTVFEPLSVQMIFTPTDPVHILAKGDLFVRVYGPATLDDFWPDVCGFIENGPRLAEGTANTMYVDNNGNLSPQGANAWTYKANGTLQRVGDGGDVNFQLHQQFLINPDWSIFKVVVEDIRLTP